MRKKGFNRKWLWFNADMIVKWQPCGVGLSVIWCDCDDGGDGGSFLFASIH